MGYGRQTTGRRVGGSRWTEHEARTILADLGRSGQSMAEFARCGGLSTARIRYWKERLGVPAAIPAFVPVSLPVAIPARVQPTIEIIAGEVSLRVREDLDVEHVARIVEALANRSRGC